MVYRARKNKKYEIEKKFNSLHDEQEACYTCGTPFELEDRGNMFETRVDYEKIKEIINKIDPMGLLKMGAPPDEYEIEIRDISLRINTLNHKMTPEEVKVIFEYHFYPSCVDKRTCLTISKEIEKIKENNIT